MRVKAALLALTIGGASLMGACSSESTTTTGANPPGSGTTVAGTAAPGTTSPMAALPGSSWVLASRQAVAPAMEDAVAGVTATLTFGTDGTLNGSTGCNTFSGTATVDGSAVTIVLGPMTMRACESPALTAQETAITTLLPMVATYAIEGDVLSLAGSGGTELLTYTAGTTGLEGTEWTGTGVNTGTAVVGSLLTEQLTASFGPDGAFGGFGGCNNLSGTYALTDPDGIAITGLAGTMMACGEEEMTLESQYTAALQKATTYSIDGDMLVLRDAEGAMQVTFRRA